MFTIFIDGLHQKVDPSLLRFFCKEFGVVLDSYIPARTRKNREDKFGFIRYETKIEALRAIRELDGLQKYGNKLKVSMARNRRDAWNDRKGGIEKGKRQEVTKINRGRFVFERRQNHAQNIYESDERTYREVMTGRRVASTEAGTEKTEQERRKETEVSLEQKKRIQVKEVEKQYLQRSLIGKINKPELASKIGDILREERQVSIEIKPLSGPFMLIVCEDRGVMEELMANDSAWLRKWFSSIRKWDKLFNNNFRCTWIRCIGIPLQLWHEDNFQKIGEIWGEVLEIDDNTAKERHLDKARLRISTSNMSLINEVIEIETNGIILEIRVMEEHVVEASMEESVDGSEVDGREEENSILPENDSPEKSNENENITSGSNEGTIVSDSYKTNEAIEEMENVSELKSIEGCSNSDMDVGDHDVINKAKQTTFFCNTGIDTTTPNSLFDSLDFINDDIEKLKFMGEVSKAANKNLKGNEENDTGEKQDPKEVEVSKETMRIEENFGGEENELSKDCPKVRMQRKKKNLRDLLGANMIKDDNITKSSTIKNKTSFHTESLSNRDIRSRNEFILKEAMKTLEIGKMCGLSIIGDEDEFLNKLIEMEMREIEKWGTNKKKTFPKVSFVGV